MGYVVVGVDGSEESRRALAWAAADARRRGAPLRVVHAYEGPRQASPFAVSYAFATSGTVGQIAADDRRWHEEQLDRAREKAETIVGRMVRDLGEQARDVTIDTVVVQSHRPAKELLDQARGADLLVVGSRGHGGFAGLLLGSVSQQLAHHSPCTLVIVRDGERDRP